MPSATAATTAAPPDENFLSPHLHSALYEIFGFENFRAHQQEAVAAALEGRDVLVVMPTGAGKSLCFQLPAALSPGLTLVVSPLVALMRDQVEALRARPAFRRLGCAYLNSSQSADEQREVLSLLSDGSLKLLYVAPERFRSPAFMSALTSIQLARFVVDEAHCISEWGHDFRPDYLSLRNVVETLGRPPLLAVTATATLRVQQSIIDNIGMREPLKLVGGFDRPNLHFAVHRCKNETARQQLLARALPRLAAMGGSGLIYAATRKGCEEVAAIAAKALAPSGSRAAAYHAGLDPTARNALQSGWLSGEIQVLVATNAFGMGIDKADVRFVVHYVYPESIESYYQEAGRAGRDGRKSRCVVLYNFADRKTREWFIENDEMKPEDIKDAHHQICRAADSGGVGASSNGSENCVGLTRLWWSNALGWNEVKARLVLGELERAGLVQRLGETQDETQLKILQSSFPRAALARITADLARHRDERFRRLDEMIGYCKTERCRRRTTLDYFGDHDPIVPLPNGDKLFCCDNCESPPQARVAANDGAIPRGERTAMPKAIDSHDIYALLQGLDALVPQVGKARLNKVLRGAASKDVEKFRSDGSPVYGALRKASSGQVDKFLDALIEEGLMHQGDEDEYFVCSITRTGREAWQSKTPLAITVPGAPASRDELGEDADALFEALRDWRRGQANTENLPPYCVLSDKTLLALAEAKPQSETALRGISGIGDIKVQKYGAAVLGIVAEAS